MNFRKTLVLFGTLMLTMGTTVAFAADEAGRGDAFGSLGAALAIGLAAFGGSLGQARVGAAALEGIARNPAAQGKIFVPMIIGLALIESLVLYAFVIALVKIKT
ncbi:MAG: ATP synthase F0 subunit C [Bdellovibrionia bacterium]